MTIVIRPPNEGGFGSGFATIKRYTGDPRTDLLIDKLLRAPQTNPLAIARKLFACLGIAEAKYPFHVGPRAGAIVELVIEWLGIDPDGEQAEELYVLRQEAREVTQTEIGAKALARYVGDVERIPKNASFNDVARDEMMEAAIVNAAQWLGLETELPILEIVEALLRAAGWNSGDRATCEDVRDVREEADQMCRSGRFNRQLRLEPEPDEVWTFEDYEIDLEAFTPCPWRYYDDIAEREAAERAEADEQAVRAAEAEIRTTRPNLAGVLAIARRTGRATLPATIGVLNLVDRIVDVSGIEMEERDLRKAIEVSIEVAREGRDRPYDDTAAEERVNSIIRRKRRANVRPLSVAEHHVGEPPAASDEAAPGLASLPTKPRMSVDITLAALTRPPGLVGEIVDFIEASAEFPSRELALGAALGFVAALSGRGYETPSRARTNLYMVALAASGRGKDHAPSCVASLAQAAGLDRFLGPARFMSASALRTSLEEQPSMVCYQDEFGGILKQIDGPKVGIHNELIRYDLLGLFSRAKDHYAGAAYANMRATKLYNPNLCIYGMSTPDEFWSALSSSRSSDGFLARFVFFQVEMPKPKRVKPAMSAGKPPKALVEAVQAVYQAVYGRGNLLGTRDGSSPFPASEVPISSGAQGILDGLEAKIDAAMCGIDSKAEPFINRIYEHALKLALTVSIGVNPSEPVIDEAVMKWAADLAWLSSMSLAREAERRIADNDRQRSFNRIVDLVRKAGVNGIAPGKLTDKLGGTLDKRLRIELIQEAEETGRIASVIVKPPTGRPSCRLVAAEFRPEPTG